MTEKSLIAWQWLAAAAATAGIALALAQPAGAPAVLTQVAAPLVAGGGLVLAVVLEFMKRQTRESWGRWMKDAYRDLTDWHEWVSSLADVLGLGVGWLLGVYLGHRLGLPHFSASFLALICALVGQQITSGLLKKQATSTPSAEPLAEPAQVVDTTADSTKNPETGGRPHVQKRRRKSNTRERRT